MLVLSTISFEDVVGELYTGSNGTARVCTSADAFNIDSRVALEGESKLEGSPMTIARIEFSGSERKSSSEADESKLGMHDACNRTPSLARLETSPNPLEGRLTLSHRRNHWMSYIKTTMPL